MACELEYAREVGELLTEAKRLIPHGEFSGWVETECGFTSRTGRTYMRIAANWALIEAAKTERGSVLTVVEARHLLAEPALPKPTSKRPHEIGETEAALLRDGRIAIGLLPAVSPVGNDEPCWFAAVTIPWGDEFVVERLARPMERVRLASLLPARFDGFDFEVCPYEAVPCDPIREGDAAADFTGPLSRLWPELADTEPGRPFYNLNDDGESRDDAFDGAVDRWNAACEDDRDRFELRPGHKLVALGSGHMTEVIPADDAGEWWWVGASLPDFLDPSDDGPGLSDFWSQNKPVNADAVPFVVENMAPDFDPMTVWWHWVPRDAYVRQARGDVPAWEDRPPEFRGLASPEFRGVAADAAA